MFRHIAIAAGAALMLIAPAALAGKAKPAPKPAKAAIVCPVMHGKVADPAKASKSVYMGKTYYFCCPGCKPLFDKNPGKYVGKK